MLVEMITAEEARNAVKINIINNDMKQVRSHIKFAIEGQNSHCVIVQTNDPSSNGYEVFLKNKETTFQTLKELGYIIRQCPDLSPLSENVFVIQWEDDYIEDRTDMTNRLNWPII
jgi:hypothetical protein